MGYSFYIISKEKEISQEDFEKAIENMSEFNRIGLDGDQPCDVHFKKDYIRISGSFGISGKYAEGFVLNLLICLMDLDYKPRVLSHDWEYGTKEDWNWFNDNRNILEEWQK